MSDIHLHSDLYHEAARRRDGEAEAWARSRAQQRAARSARSARSRLAATVPTRRVRILAAATPMLSLLALGLAVLAGAIA